MVPRESTNIYTIDLLIYSYWHVDHEVIVYIIRTPIGERTITQDVNFNSTRIDSRTWIYLQIVEFRLNISDSRVLGVPMTEV